MNKVQSHRLAKSLLNNFQDSLQTFSNEQVSICPKVLTIEMYDVHSIDSLAWPQTADGIEAKNFLLPLVKNGTSHYFNNIDTEIKLLKIQNTIIPFTINNKEYENSYVCSPYNYYITYAQHSLHEISSNVLKNLAKSALWGLSKIFKFTQFNKVIIVNNWLNSTNLFPALNSKTIPVITKFFQQHYPDHALIFRCIDQETNSDHFECLKQTAFRMIATRQIFFTDTKKQQIFDARLFKSDIKLLDTCGYDVIDHSQLTNQDIDRLLDLYNQVFIQKHSSLNPQINKAYLQLALEQQTLQIKVLKKDNQIDGVVGYFCRNGVMTCPLFGYDQTLPAHPSLYRLLSTLLMLEAKKHSVLFHQSAGASTYKKIRKAQDCIEYMAVYDKHLSLKRRLPWLVMSSLCNTVGIYCMKKY